MTEPTRITRRTHVTDPAAALDEALRENDVLAGAIAELQANSLTSEEHAYLRRKKEADDNAAWLWQTIRTNAPWATVVCSLVGSALYWVLTHTIQIGGPRP
jgi:hypothetical protein